MEGEERRGEGRGEERRREGKGEDGEGRGGRDVYLKVQHYLKVEHSLHSPQRQ